MRRAKHFFVRKDPNEGEEDTTTSDRCGADLSELDEVHPEVVLNNEDVMCVKAQSTV